MQHHVTFALGSGMSTRAMGNRHFTEIVYIVLRPVTEAGTRVTPTELLNHRITHEFKAPSCLCACINPGTSYTESAIYLNVAIDSPYFGEYMAGCASGTCGYLGKLTLNLHQTIFRLLTLFSNSSYGVHVYQAGPVYTKVPLEMYVYIT